MRNTLTIPALIAVVALAACDHVQPFHENEILVSGAVTYFAVGARGAVSFRDNCFSTPDFKESNCRRKTVEGASASFSDPSVFELISVAGNVVNFDVLAPGVAELTVSGSIDGDPKTASLELEAREIDEIALSGPMCRNGEDIYSFLGPAKVAIQSIPKGGGQGLAGEGIEDVEFELPQGVTVGAPQQSVTRSGDRVDVVNRREIDIPKNAPPGATIFARAAIGDDSREIHIADPGAVVAAVLHFLGEPEEEFNLGARSPEFTAQLQFDPPICNPNALEWTARFGPPEVCAGPLGESELVQQERGYVQPTLVGPGVCEVEVIVEVGGRVLRDSGSFTVLEPPEDLSESESDAGP